MTPLNLVGALPLTATGVCLISARRKHPDAFLYDSIDRARLPDTERLFTAMAVGINLSLAVASAAALVAQMRSGSRLFLLAVESCVVVWALTGSGTRTVIGLGFATVVLAAAWLDRRRPAAS